MVTSLLHYCQKSLCVAKLCDTFHSSVISFEGRHEYTTGVIFCANDFEKKEIFTISS